MTLTEREASAPLTQHRVLVSADAHGGAPLGELEGVFRRIERSDADGAESFAAMRAPRLASDEDGLNRSPQVLPEDRLKEMERDGVSAEVIYGSTGLLPDETLADGIKRCQQVNDWMADTYKNHLDIMAPSISLPLPSQGIGRLSPEPPDLTDDMVRAAADEIKRCAANGMRPGLVPDTSRIGFNHPMWNPVWEAACEVDIPLSFHAGFGTNPHQTRNPGGAVSNFVTVAATIIKSVTQLCASGVFETFPQLQCIFTETGAGWLAWTMWQMDEAAVVHKQWVKPKLQQPPSEYCRNNIVATFQEDPIGLRNRDYTGLKSLMWGSDYPHYEGTWPRSQQVVQDLFAGIPEDEVDQIVHRNAAQAFKFKIPGVDSNRRL